MKNSRFLTIIVVAATLICFLLPQITYPQNNALRVHRITKLGAAPLLGGPVNSIDELIVATKRYESRIKEAVILSGHSEQVADEVVKNILAGKVEDSNIRKLCHLSDQDAPSMLVQTMSWWGKNRAGKTGTHIIYPALLDTGDNEEFWLVKVKIGQKLVRFMILKKCGNLGRIDACQIVLPPITEIDLPTEPEAIPSPPLSPIIAKETPVVPQLAQTISCGNSTSVVVNNTPQPAQNSTIIAQAAPPNSYITVNPASVTIIMVREQGKQDIPATQFDKGTNVYKGVLSSSITFAFKASYSQRVVSKGGSSSSSTSSSSSSSSSTNTAVSGGAGGGSASAGAASDGSSSSGAAASGEGGETIIEINGDMWI